jgi:hypothetical protein
VGGTINMANTGSAVISLNSQLLSLQNVFTGTFEFPSPLLEGTDWSVSVHSSSGSLICTVNNGEGTSISGDIDNVAIICGATTTSEPECLAIDWSDQLVAAGLAQSVVDSVIILFLHFSHFESHMPL